MLPMMYMGALLVLSASQGAGASEEGDVASYFNGAIEVVSQLGISFAWLESPLWSESGEYLLFSDVKWVGAAGTTGMVWKYDSQSGVSPFLQDAGIVGPGALPADLANHAEAGPNGMIWSWSGYPMLLMCQHAMKRIVQFDVNDVSNGSISSNDVTVVADTYGAEPLNSPNDMTLIDGTAFFTDPPYGLKMFGDDGLDPAYARMTQNVTGIYAVNASFATTGPQLLLDSHIRPNGIAVTASKKVFLAHTEFDNPGYSVYDTVDGDLMKIDAASARRFSMTHRINETVTPGYPALADGMTAHEDVVFAAGPGGVYVLDGSSGLEVAFVRIDDLVSNVEVGGDYLWITANQRLLRIKLASSVGTNPGASNFDANGAVTRSLGLVGWLVAGWSVAV